MRVANAVKTEKPSFLGRIRQAPLWEKGLMLLIVIGLLWFIGTQAFGQKNSGSQYQTAKAQRGNIIATVSESGNVNAGSQTQVTSPSDGIVQQVFVKNGDQVTQGEKLFTVKSTATPQEKASAYASYENALANYDTAIQAKQALVATLEKDRQAILNAQDAVNYQSNNPGASNPTTKQPYNQLEIDSLNSALTNAQETFAADQTRYDQADTAIGAASAAVNSQSLAYQYTQDATVVAPIAGTVANLSVQPGDAVTASTATAAKATSSSSSSSSSSANGGSVVLSIGNYKQLSILAQVNEVDIPKIKIGQNAIVTLDAFPGETFAGKVVRMDSVGTITSGVVTYNVTINLLAPPSSVKPGMSASVAIQTARADNVITVPSTAVQMINGASYVKVLKKGQVSIVPVKTGISDDTNTEIISGISAGTVVMTGTSTSGTSTTSPFSGGFGGKGGVLFRRGG